MEKTDHTEFPKVSLLMGQRMIDNIADPKPEEIDLDHIQQALDKIGRYSGHAKAHSVWEHCLFVMAIYYYQHGFNESGIRWALHHDDEESVIGDLNSPIKAAINKLTGGYWHHCAGALSRAIYQAREWEFPSDEVIKQVKRIDHTTAVYSWVFRLERKERWPEFVMTFDDGSQDVCKCDYMIEISDKELVEIERITLEVADEFRDREDKIYAEWDEDDVINKIIYEIDTFNLQFNRELNR